MKKILFVLLGFMSMVSLTAQNNITIGIVMPEQEINGIKPDTFKLLQSKLERMLTNSGVSSYGGDFVLYPVVNIVEDNLIEGGIKNFYKVGIELVLNVANVSSHTLFSSESWSLSGVSERVKNDAIKNAFSQLKGSDPRFKSFIDESKRKIVQYYENNKQDILAKATSLASSGEWEQALAFLSSYPSQVNGYAEAQEMMAQIYNKYYLNANAAKILNEAKGAFAVKNYSKAVSLAAQIDKESSYYDEAALLINQVREIVQKEQDEANERTMKALEMASDLEKTRINAAASVARAYYNRRVVNYNTVVVW